MDGGSATALPPSKKSGWVGRDPDPELSREKLDRDRNSLYDEYDLSCMLEFDGRSGGKSGL